MKNILLPTDFSDNSWHAIQYALQLFNNQECTFHLLHTYMPNVYTVDNMPTGIGYTGLADSLKEVSDNGLAKFKQNIIDHYNSTIKIETRSALNTLLSEIREVIKEKQIDLIIMGTKGASGIAGTMLGTNSIHVINEIECPTIIVPENYRFSILKKILFPTDYELLFKQEHVTPIINIAETNKAEVHLLHVLAKNTNQISEEQENNKSRLHSFLKEIKTVSHVTDHKYIPTAVNDFLLETDIDLITMMNNKNSFFDNIFFKPIISKIGFELKVPFLVIPSKSPHKSLFY